MIAETIDRDERPLTEAERDCLRAIAPVTHAELAMLLGISPARVQQLEDRAVKKIFQALRTAV